MKLKIHEGHLWCADFIEKLINMYDQKTTTSI